eukprot:c45881_g1_i1 orf=228-389(+)
MQLSSSLHTPAHDTHKRIHAPTCCTQPLTLFFRLIIVLCIGLAIAQNCSVCEL